MGKIRYINGWECPCCYELHSTERKANNCFDRDEGEYKSKKDMPKKKMVLLKGWECIECLKIHDKKEIAKKCCNPKYPQYTESPNPYNVIGKSKKKKFALEEKSE